MASQTGPTSYLAFDLGAGSCRAMLGTLMDGRIRIDELHRFATPILERDDHLYWDVDRIWDELLHGLRIALDAAPGLRSLSVNSWGVDYVPLDSDYEPVRLPYCYRDPRWSGKMAEAFSRVPEHEIYRVTGIQFMEINTLYQWLADLEDHPDLIAQTATNLLIADYFNFRFSGAPVAEASLASTSQAFDVREGEWADELLEVLGLVEIELPHIVTSGKRLGAARQASGVEVVAGCSHDTACAVAATPGSPDEPWAYISCGSWSLLGVERSAPLLTERARTAGFTNEAGLDGTIRFLKNLNGLFVLQECEREWREEGQSYTYDELFAEAREAPSLGIYLDLDDESFALRGNMVEKLAAYCTRRGAAVPQGRGAITRAILESLTHAYDETLGVLEEVIDQDIEVLHIVGGGAQNDLLCQWTSDACQIPVVAGPVEATALGNLLVQARAMGDLPPDLLVRDVVRESVDLETYEPDRPAAP